MLLASAPAQADNYKYAKINCRTSSLFLLPPTKYFMLVDPAQVNIQPGGFLAVQGRRIVSKGIDDPALSMCSYEYDYVSSEDIEILPPISNDNDRHPLPEPGPIPPCMFPGQYSYCLNTMMSQRAFKETRYLDITNDDTPFYEIRDFNAITLAFRSEESIITCHPGSTLDFVVGENLVEPLIDIFVASRYSDALGREIAASRGQVNAQECLFLDEL